MSTRARIGIKLDDGGIVSIYSHWDGYPSALGATLAERYIDKNQVVDLIEGGNVSTVMSWHDWDGNLAEKEFVLYYRERGDEDVDSHYSENLDDYLDLTRSSWGEFAYLFDPLTNRWECYNMHLPEMVDLYEQQIVTA